MRYLNRRSSPGASVSALELTKFASCPFVGALDRSRRGSRRGPAFLGTRRPCRNAFRRFPIQGLRLWGTQAALGQREHIHNKALRSFLDLEPVVRSDRVGGLDAVPVDVDLAALNRLRSETARLEEASRPEPLVDPDGFLSRMLPGHMLQRNDSGRQVKGHGVTAQQETAEAVVLVHGIWMTGYELFWLRYRLRRCGFRCYRFHYPSLRRNPAANVRRLRAFVDRIDAPVVHYVGHSLGGRVILDMLASDPPPRPGHVVCLGTPVQGSHVACWFARRRVLRGLLGNASEVLTTPHGDRPQGRSLGVIAGTRGIGVGRLVPGTPEPNDGVVAVAEAYLEGAGFCGLPVSHVGMAISNKVAARICQFLKSGRFADEARERK